MEDPSVSTAAVPTVEAAKLAIELDKMREQLRVSDEWNIRLQNELQKLLHLPRNVVEQMRSRMKDPDIAIPLLQCYDAAIQERADENTALQEENARLRTKVATTEAEQAGLTNAVRVAEELATYIQGKAKEEVHQFQETIKALQMEVQKLRQEVGRSMDGENNAKADLEREQRRAAALQEEVERLRVEYASVGESLRLTQNRMRLRDREENEGRKSSEIQEVQLNLLTKENDDKLRELERLRAKMVQALRQASENHAAHLRVVEERHRFAIEELRNAHRTQELEVLKLRAQLARADPSNPAGGPQRFSAAHGVGMRSTTELLETQTRQAQEMEIRRLSGELAAAQTQRDDAVRRYEQQTSDLRRDHDQHVEDARREVLQLRKRLEEQQQHEEDITEELTSVKSQLKQLKDKIRSLQQEGLFAQQEKTGLERQLQEARQKANEASEESTRAKDSAKDAIASERLRAERLEQRVEEMRKEFFAVKSRAYEELAQAQKKNASEHKLLQETQKTLKATQHLLATREREREALSMQLEKLNDALTMHKQQLGTCDARALQLQDDLEDARRKQKELLLSVERLRMENMRLERSHNRLLESINTRAL